MGMPKAKVLPVPVGALAVTSCQSIMGGMHPAWMGVDSTYPFFSSARISSGDSPRESKRTPCVISIVSFLTVVSFFWFVQVNQYSLPQNTLLSQGRQEVFPESSQFFHEIVT